jgi:hypothetical protein
MHEKILKDVIEPALDELAGLPITDAARVLLLACARQESGLTARYQAVPGGGKGQGRGLWQLRPDDVNALLVGGSTRARAEAAAIRHVGSVNLHAVWATLEYNDVLASPAAAACQLGG